MSDTNKPDGVLDISVVEVAIPSICVTLTGERIRQEYRARGLRCTDALALLCQQKQTDTKGA